MKEIPIRAYGAVVVLIKKDKDDGRFLLLRRVHEPVGTWCYVAGGIEENEKAYETAIREAKEETGLEVKELYSASLCEQFYEIRNDAVWIAPVFVGFVDESVEVKTNHEHNQFKWCTKDECMDLLIFSGQKQIIGSIHRDFVMKQPTPLLKINIQKPA
jgi:dATP pyrophosphohydrolase